MRMRKWITVPILALALITAACGRVPSTEPADPGDLVRGEVMIEGSEILQLESYPVQVYLLLTGSLPTPCHILQWEVQEADSEGRILVEVYSLIDPEAICAQVLEPFEERIHLGDFTSGSFSVWVNEEKVGEFNL